MPYRRGDLKLAGLCPDEESLGHCSHELEHDDETPRDSRDNYRGLISGAYLPHSCDQWVIGGPEEIQALISDLRLALISLGIAGSD